MNAWQMTRYAGVDGLRYADIAVPTPGPGELRFVVEASSVNPIDWKLAKGMLRWIRPMRLPWTPTFDGAGHVDAVGPGVQGWAVGDRVATRIGSKGGGAAAELAVANVVHCARVPDGVDIEAAAAVPLAGMTAWQGLFDAGGMAHDAAGLRVLIIGAAGGVGHLAVQLAVETGAEVIGACSTANVDRVRSLGVLDVIDYREEPDYGRCGPYDVVYDTVGVGLDASRRFLKPGAVYLTPFPKPGDIVAAAASRLGLGPRVRLVMLKPTGANLAQLLERLADGRLKVWIDSRFDADALPDAWRRSMSGRAVGKIVVRGRSADANASIRGDPR